MAKNVLKFYVNFRLGFRSSLLSYSMGWRRKPGRKVDASEGWVVWVCGAAKWLSDKWCAFYHFHWKVAIVISTINFNVFLPLFYFKYEEWETPRMRANEAWIFSTLFNTSTIFSLLFFKTIRISNVYRSNRIYITRICTVKMISSNIAKWNDIGQNCLFVFFFFAQQNSYPSFDSCCYRALYTPQQSCYTI